MKQKTEQALGVYPASGKEVFLKKGRYGFYLNYDGKNIKLPNEFKSGDLNIDDAIAIINSQG